MTVEDEEPLRKGLYFLGVDITKRECVRKPLLEGFKGAAIGGLLGFLHRGSLQTGIYGVYAGYAVGVFVSCYLCHCEVERRQKFWSELNKKPVKEKREEDAYFLPQNLESRENKKAEEKV